jgi:dTDP-glucose pyrophosphorylase
MKKYKNLFIDKKSSLITTLKKMDSERTKLLIVGTDEDFQGLVTIGDLQRAIIKNMDLDTSIEKILRNDIVVATEHENRQEIREKMLAIRAQFMPVVNDEGKIVNVVFWEDLLKSEKLPPSENVMLPVIIMAGGKGTRLKPITNVLPKPLIPLGEKPILEHIINRFVEVGCNEFYLSVNYKSEFIEYYFNSFEHPGYSIRYFKEEKPLGTAGSLHILNGKIKSTFFVSNCDIIIDQDYSEIYRYHKNNGNELTLVVALKHYVIPYGSVETGADGLLERLLEKPEVTYKINAGLYILEPHLLEEIPKNEFFHITDLINKIQLRKGKVGVFPVSEKSWRDIGEWDEYLKNNTYQL